MDELANAPLSEKGMEVLGYMKPFLDGLSFEEAEQVVFALMQHIRSSGIISADS